MMSNSGEIVTLQFGHYSNFVGTHWWNIQETSFDYTGNTQSEINHDVLYREGQNLKGEITYTPRLLLVDLKGSLKHLSEYGDLYKTYPEANISQALWEENKVEVETTEIIEQNEFQRDIESIPVDNLNKDYNFESGVKVWSDYLLPRFHHRTVNCIKEYQHNNAEMPFDIFPLGSELWKTEYFEDDFTDSIRKYIEECDHIQGFHIILDSIDGFAGLSGSCMQYLKDEYGTKSIFAFPVIPTYYPDYNITNSLEREKSAIKDTKRLINLALCYDNLAEFSSLFVPLCTSVQGWKQPGPIRNFKYLNINSKLHYHTSAVLATALDTFTLHYRKHSNSSTLLNLCTSLNMYGRKAAASSLGLPFGLQEDTDFIDCLDDWQGPLWENLTPNCTIDGDCSTQIVSLRGVQENQLKKTSSKAGKQKEMPAYQCESVQSMLKYYLSCTCSATASHVTSLSTPLQVKIPFPKIFSPNVSNNGLIIKNTFENENVNSVPVIAGLHSGSYIGHMLETLNRDISRIKIKKFHQFMASGLEFDEYKECLNRLLDFKENYDDN